MADSTQYSIDIATRMAGGDTAVAQLAALEGKLTAAGEASTAAAAAVKAGVAAYNNAEAAAGAAARAVDKLAAAANTQREKMAAAMSVGDAKGFWRAAGKLEEFTAKHAAAVEATQAAVGAVNAEGAALANLRAQAQSAADGVKGLTDAKKALTAEAKSAAKAEQSAAREAIKAENDKAKEAKTAAKEAIKAEKDKAKEEKTAAKEAIKAEKSKAKDIAKAQKEAAKAAQAAQAGAGSGNLKGVADGLKKLGGPLGHTAGQLGDVAEGFEKFKGALGSAGPYVAIAAAIVIITTALIAGTIAIAKWAVGLADTRRSIGLANEGLAASSEALVDIASILPRVANATGLAIGKLQGMAESLAAAGIKAKDMPDALRAIAMATEGGATAEFIAKLNADLKAGTKSAAALAAEVEKKFGGIVAKKMLSLDAQAEKLKGNIATLFGGLKIEKLLEGLATLVAMFDKNTAVGKTLKFLFETLFQPIIDGAVKFIPIFEGAMIQVVIMALKAYIAFQQIRHAVSEAFGLQHVKSAEVALYAVAGVCGFILGVVAGIGAIFVLAGVAIAVALAPIIAVAAAVYVGITSLIWLIGEAASAFGAAGGAIVGAFGAVWDYLSGLGGKLAALGTAMIEGLANGISAGAAAVVGAITGVVGGAIDAAKALLHINSPSKVFMAMGQSTGEGFEMGVDDTTASVQGSLESMVSPDGAAAAASAPTKGGKTKGSGMSLDGAIFNFYGVEGMDDAESRIGGLLTRIIEGDLSQLGGATA